MVTHACPTGPSRLTAAEFGVLYRRLVSRADFFTSIGAVNPSLTAIANALRVGDHIAARPR